MIRCDNRFGYLGLHYHVGFSRSPLLIVIYILRVCGRVHRKKILLCFVSLNFFKKMLRAYFDLGSVKIVFFLFFVQSLLQAHLGIQNAALQAILTIHGCGGAAGASAATTAAAASSAAATHLPLAATLPFPLPLLLLQSQTSPLHTRQGRTVQNGGGT